LQYPVKTGGRTAWSSAVEIAYQRFQARYWYNGHHNAYEDAAEVAYKALIDSGGCVGMGTSMGTGMGVGIGSANMGVESGDAGCYYTQFASSGGGDGVDGGGGDGGAVFGPPVWDTKSQTK
jgi:hypothetical protein